MQAVLITYRETRRCFFDDATMRVRGARARAPKNYRTDEVLTAELQVVVPLRGAFVYEWGSSHSLLTTNHALFVAGGDISRDRFVDEQPLDYMLIDPQLESLSAALGPQAVERVAHLAETKRVAVATPDLQRAASMFWNASVTEGWCDDVAKEEAALNLMLAVARTAGLAPSRRPPAAQRWVDAVKEVIGTGGKSFSLTQISSQVGASPAYLTDLFRRMEGISIAHYQRRLRLSRALVELAHTNDLTALALELGFSSHAHFSTAFRAAYGETPSAFRARLRGSEKS